MGPPIPIYEPLESGEKDNIFISKSYDSTSHFETTTSKFGHPAFLGPHHSEDADFALLDQMISGICTVVPRVRSSRWKVFVRGNSLPRSKLNSGQLLLKWFNCCNRQTSSAIISGLVLFRLISLLLRQLSHAIPRCLFRPTSRLPTAVAE